MAYASVATLRAHIDRISVADDAVLAQILDAATVSIDRACNRYIPGFEYFEAPVNASARTYAGSGKAWQRIDPCIAVALVETRQGDAWAAWDADDWLAFQGSYERANYADLPHTALMATGAYTAFPHNRRRPTVRVTAPWGGYVTPPADIAEACVMQAARWYKREQSAMSDTLATPEMGVLLYQKSLDPDIRRILIDGRHVNSVVYGL